MKIRDIKTFAVDCFRTNWVFVKVYTDEGIDGVGEATLEYKEKSLIGAVEHIKEYLVGKNPLDIEKHWHDIYRDAYWRGGGRVQIYSVCTSQSVRTSCECGNLAVSGDLS